jgi:hypothetical protein
MNEKELSDLLFELWLKKGVLGRIEIDTSEFLMHHTWFGEYGHRVKSDFKTYINLPENKSKVLNLKSEASDERV